MPTLPFTDRFEAGRQLAAELAGHSLPANTLALAVARGGVPVGAALAKALGIPLDVLIVRKVDMPDQKEVSMGAIAAGGEEVLDREFIETLQIPVEEVDVAVKNERAELLRRERLYREDRPPLALRGRTVVLVDDGIATGSTMLAATRYVRSRMPAMLLIAVPVTSVHGCRRLHGEADGHVFVAVPEPFISVGAWYQHFPLVGDEEVSRLLREHWATETQPVKP